MRIAIFSDNFYPELGGIQDSIALLGRELGRRGHHADFYAPRASAEDYRRANFPVGEINLGERVSVHRFFSFPFPSPTQQSRFVFPTGFRSCLLQETRPDVIHAQTFFGVGLEALFAAWRLKIPFVGTNHWAISEFSHYGLVSKKIFDAASRTYVSWYYNRCDFVTAPSASVIEEMRAFGLRKPAEVVSNPIDTDTFSPPAGNVKTLKVKYKLSDASIVFASRLGKEKNFDVILRAVALVKKEIPSITFAIAGHGSEREPLEALAENLGVADNVRFTGTLDKPSLAELYQASEIFTIMSTSETQSMVLLQAMACGLPAIGARWRGLPEYIKPDTGILVEPGNHAELAQEIINLLLKPKERARLGAGARQFSLQFGAAQIGKRWEEIYRRAIENKDHK